MAILHDGQQYLGQTYSIALTPGPQLLEPKLVSPTERRVLSACQTAAGDNRATLGLAGIALQSGASSTLATLWPVSDEATALLMSQFYSALADGTVTKAEALRQAQQALITQPKFQHPFFWAPYTLVGNWR